MIDFHSHLDLYPDGLKLAQEVNMLISTES